MSLKAQDVTRFPVPAMNVRRQPSVDWPILRLALLGDIPELVEVEGQAFPSRTPSEAAWRGVIGSRGASVVVAEDYRELLGVYVLLFNEQTLLARLQFIAVAGAWKRCGIGRVLVQDAIVRSVARGATLLRSDGSVNDDASAALLQHLGFIPQGRSGIAKDTVRFELKLVG